MNPTKLALAYCLDNVSVAEAIESQLSSHTDYRFDHFFCKKGGSGQSINEKLAGYPGKVILLISDNFLRCEGCMSKGLDLLENRSDEIMPVLLQGFQKEGETGSLMPVETRIDKVSDIIHYINFWQNKFLEHRKTQDSNGSSLERIQEISSETGDYLRLMRKFEPLPLEELQAEHFAPFFKFMEDPESYDAFVNQGEADIEAFAQPEVSGEDLSSIPGMDLLASRDAEGDPIQAAEEDSPEPFIAPGSDTAEDDDVLDWDDPDALLEASKDAVRDDSADRALDILEEAVDAHPDHIPLRYYFALLLAKSPTRLYESEDQLELLLRADPEHADARFLQGEVAEIRENFDDALSRYQALADAFPDYPGIYYRLGLLQARYFPDLQHYALDNLHKALKEDANNLDARYQYAALLAETGEDDEKAEGLLLELLEEMPYHPFAHYDLALLYHRLRRHDEAKENYLTATTLNSELRNADNDRAFGIDPETTDSTEESAEMIELEPTLNQHPVQGSDLSEETPEPEIPEIAEPTYEESAETIMEESPQPAEIQETDHSDDPLEALKQNIHRLENMLKGRQAPSPAPKKEAVPPKEDRIVMVTGATSGIGRATANLFAKNGFRLIITGRRQDRLDRLAKIFEDEHGTSVRSLCFDVREKKELVQEYAEKLDFEWRQVDILINNAGKAKGLDPIYNGKIEHWDEMIDTNIKGLLYMTRAILPNMLKRRTGHIINVASTAGKEVYANGNVYCATKFAVDALTKAMRIDLVDYNIRVGQVSPGHVEQTEFSAVRFDGDQEQAKKVYDNFVPLNAHDVADAIYYIATRPRHVNIQDILMMGSQQAGASKIDRAGRERVLDFIERIRPRVD